MTCDFFIGNMGKRKEDLRLPSPITPEDPSFKSLGIKHWFSAQRSLGLKGYSRRNSSEPRRTEDQGHVMGKIQLAQEGTTPQVLESQVHNWYEEVVAAGAFMTLEDRIKAEQQWEKEAEIVPLSYKEPDGRFSIDESWLTESIISEEDLVGFHEATLDDLEQEEPLLYETDVAPRITLDQDEIPDPLVRDILLKGESSLNPLKWEPQSHQPNIVVGTNGYSDQSRSISEEDYSQESWA